MNSSIAAQAAQDQSLEQSHVAPLVRLCRHLLQPNGGILGKEVAAAVLPHIPHLLAAIPTTSPNKQALQSTDGRLAVSHAEISEFLLQTGQVLHRHAVGRGHRIAVILPNGPELALAILTVSCWATCVPLNAFGAAAELEADLRLAQVDLVVCLHPKHSADGMAIHHLAAAQNIPAWGLIPDRIKAGIFTLVPHATHIVHPPRPKAMSTTLTATAALTAPSEADRSAGNSVSAFWDPQHPHAHHLSESLLLPNQHSDQVLILFTSGTTGSKKLVPHLLEDILVATACISVSWQLTEEDTNCNLMPLFHVGGIIRQVFSPILSGGAVICCPSFDPVLFWQLLNQEAFTWYYAAPTMHQLILQTGKTEGHIRNKVNTRSPRLRMIANAAGALLPSLARELRQVFRAAVLPSYGMTECMPITSPPANYQLNKPGTSGVSVGPEICILNLTSLQSEETGKEGPICVRGAPCFRGYEHIPGPGGVQEAVAAPNTFLPGGWFNTGDLGYMDADGYLYITGRSKEVINRGGEIISPMEVEEAVNSHSDVFACVAFSTQHSVLQEVVGLVVVPVPNRPRLDLPSLHAYVGQGLLAAPKWPQCLVYMDDVPKSHTNKLLRVKLGQRLSLPELNDSMHWIERTFQANCPPKGTPVSVAVPCERVSIDPAQVQAALIAELVVEPDQQLWVVPHPSRIGGLVIHVYKIDRMAVLKAAREKLDAYAVPSHICQLNQPVLSEHDLTLPESSDALGSIEQEASLQGAGPADPLIMELQDVFQHMLDLDCQPAPDTNFFNLGGSSMLASQLASRVRKLHGVPFGGAEVFHHSSCNAIARVIRDRQAPPGPGGSNGSILGKDPASAASSLFSKNIDLRGAPFDPTRIDVTPGLGALFFQLVPLFVCFPVWQLSRFFLFFRCLLLMLKQVPSAHTLLVLVLTLVIFHMVWVFFTPLLFIVLKWSVIGSYRKGRYALWSEYYLRWWFVDVLRKLIGRGIWGSNHVTLNFYYRLLGARIGKNARISLEADVAEYDLLTIGEGAAVEYATVRGFGVDNGCMLLGPVEVGNFASVGVRAVVAPFTTIPDDAHLGPCTASYEVNAFSDGSDVRHVEYNRQALPEPSIVSQIFVVGPITFFVDSLSHTPALLVLYWMVNMPWHLNEPFDSMSDLMEWLCDVRRVPFYIGIRLSRALISPLVYMASAILVKWLVIGKFEPGPRDKTSEWQLIRHHLAATLFSRENMQDAIELLGRHYELVSILYRLLGAKVGKRVFWPGHQPIFTGEFDLLEIGDDVGMYFLSAVELDAVRMSSHVPSLFPFSVVFGSRSSIFCTTIHSCEKVQLCAGANISDNTVVLPGSIIGKNAVLGSNSVCPASRYLPESSIWFGSRGGEPVMLDKGVVSDDSNGTVMSSEVEVDLLQMEGDESTLRPFGKAFYHRDASYFVLPLSFMIFFTIVCKTAIATIHTLPLLGAVHASAAYFYGLSYEGRAYKSIEIAFPAMYVVLLSFFFLTHLFRVVLWILVEMGAKWAFMGHREEGRYNWDTSAYGQNWEMYQIISRVRSFGRMNFLDFIRGSPYLVSFFRLLGSKIGDDCCLYPTGGDPYMPEPDMVDIGDRCVIDCASVVCHLNTRGNFELKKIILENNVTLRTRSRIQQGVYMEQGSMLLEKSLVMTGEVIEADSVWQGAPASRLLSYDTSSINTRLSERSTGHFV